MAAQGYDGWRYPHVLGVDVAGVIETTGEGVVSWNRGDQIFYHTTWRKDGSYAEFNVAPAHTFARIPEVKVGKIRPTVAEQITLEAIPKALEPLAEGHVRGKIVAEVQS